MINNLFIIRRLVFNPAIVCVRLTTVITVCIDISRDANGHGDAWNFHFSGAAHVGERKLKLEALSGGAPKATRSRCQYINYVYYCSNIYIHAKEV